MYEFSHESYDAYRLAVDVARWVRKTRWPAGSPHLRDQAMRAADSVVLNIAEGFGRAGAAGRNHFRIARGSAAEVCAVLDLVELEEGPAKQQLLRRVGATLTRMR